MTVLLCNASFIVLSRIDWRHAVTMLVTGDAVAIESDPAAMVRSQRLAIPMPTIIVLTRYVAVDTGPAGGVEPVSRLGVLRRDRFTCGYCGAHGDTVDHVLPLSRGGRDVWDNLVAACQPCNNLKADRLPVEAGMRLRWVPYPVRRNRAHVTDQQRVWAALEAA